MEHSLITYQGQAVRCYGKWKWDSNCTVVAEDEHGETVEEMYADGAEDWEDAVQRVSDALPFCLIIELKAC